MTISQTNASGTAEDSWIIGRNNAEVELYYNGTVRLETTSTGFIGNGTIGGISSTAASDTRIIADNTAGGIAMQVESTGAGGIYQLSAAQALEDLWIVMARNGAVELRHNNGDAIATQNDSASYVTSGGLVTDHGGTFRDIGFNVMPVIEQDSSTSLDENDVGKILHRDTTSTITYTLPSGTSGAIPPVGSTIMIANENTGTLNITAAGTLRWFQGAGAAPQTGTRNLARDGICTVYHYANTEWWIWGAGIS